MNIVLWKLIILVLLFFLTFTLTLLPLKLVARLRNSVDPVLPSRHDRFISLLSCFAGGVFMATGLLDLLPQVDATFIEVKKVLQMTSHFPIAEFTVAMGFFMVLLVEQLVLDCKESNVVSTSVVDMLEAGRCEQEQRRLLQHDNHDELPPPSQNPVSPALRSLLLVAALSLHSLFEGVAVGLQQDAASLLHIALAVFLHKAVVAFSLGLSLARSRLSFAATFWSALLLGAMSPVGVGIGMTVDHFGQGILAVVVTATLEGLACGTFVYVTFFEVLPHELKSNTDRKFKLLMVIVGFAAVCGLLLLDL